MFSPEGGQQIARTRKSSFGHEWTFRLLHRRHPVVIFQVGNEIVDNVHRQVEASAIARLRMLFDDLDVAYSRRRRQELKELGALMICIDVRTPSPHEPMILPHLPSV